VSAAVGYCDVYVNVAMHGTVHAQLSPEAYAVAPTTSVPLSPASWLNPPSTTSAKVPPSVVLSWPVRLRVTSSAQMQVVPVTSEAVVVAEKLPPSSVYVLAAVPWNCNESVIPAAVPVAQSIAVVAEGVLTSASFVVPPSAVLVTTQVVPAEYAENETGYEPSASYPAGQESEELQPEATRRPIERAPSRKLAARPVMAACASALLSWLQGWSRRLRVGSSGRWVA
jgi:hypothetical protein